ncbi:MAG: Si-specific NAD(P)(+) transhydrogenase [Myxococcota bacterium]|nr:Si-specific NAD(P)(+) transhydrogenase [Myxococcota bacterium]
MRDYDLCVIGSGPGGQKAAIQAAKLGKSVCVIERMDAVGGVAINTGTIPSKALREAVLELTRGGCEPLSLRSHTRRNELTIENLLASCQRIIQKEIQIVRSHLAKNGVDLIYGQASFIDPVTVETASRGGRESLRATSTIIAVGTQPARPADLPLDGHSVLTTDDVLGLRRLPHTMIVVGGGVIGTEYASIFAELGVRVTLLDAKPRLLEFVDNEVVEALQYHLRHKGMTLRLKEKVTSIATVAPPADHPCPESMVQATLDSGKQLRADCLLYCVGRQGAVEGLGLENVGIEPDKRGRIPVDARYRTSTPNIYAVGDIIGFPALASTSMDQGRVAACNLYGVEVRSLPELFPYGIYSIPEISMVGRTEQALTEAAVPYETGVAQYREIARGQLIGDEAGMLKLLIHQETHQVLGVHALGTGATELIHIGQMLMAFGGKADYFVDAVFNYPTLAECYKVAALNGLNKLRSI